MKYIEYKEHRKHGSKEFPYAYYHTTSIHPRYNMIYHWHTEYELIYVVSGRMELSVDGDSEMLYKGDCAVITGGVLHGGTPYDCVYDCLVFDMDALLKVNAFCARKMTPIVQHNKKIISFYQNGEPLCAFAKNLFKSIRELRSGYEFIVPGELLKIFGYIFENNKFIKNGEISSVDTKRLRQFKNVLSYISEHYHESVSLSDLALICKMNSNYFCRAFKEFSKKTPMEYLNYYRIESACEQLVSTDDDLISIAFNCGFNDYSYFTKVFKKYKGKTPHKYRNELFIKNNLIEK